MLLHLVARFNYQLDLIVLLRYTLIWMHINIHYHAVLPILVERIHDLTIAL